MFRLFDQNSMAEMSYQDALSTLITLLIVGHIVNGIYHYDSTLVSLKASVKKIIEHKSDWLAVIAGFLALGAAHASYREISPDYFSANNTSLENMLGVYEIVKNSLVAFVFVQLRVRDAFSSTVFNDLYDFACINFNSMAMGMYLYGSNRPAPMVVPAVVMAPPPAPLLPPAPLFFVPPAAAPVPPVNDQKEKELNREGISFGRAG